MAKKATSSVGLQTMLQTSEVLRLCCGSIVASAEGAPTSGTKALRLVNKQCRDIMAQDNEPCYRLEIRTELAPLPNIVNSLVPNPQKEWKILCKIHL